jgi:putative transposase
MLLLRGFRFLLLPTQAQRHFFAGAAGCARLVWNTALDFQKQRAAQQLPNLSYEDLCDLLKLWKHEKAFLKEAPSQALQQRLKDFSQALEEAKDPSNPKQFPVFKKKGEDDSFRYPQHFKLEQERSKISLPKLGWVRYIKSQEVTGIVKNVTISQEAGRWYLSIQTEQVVQEPKHPSSSVTAGDLGVVHFLTLSDGTHFDAPDYKPLEQKIKRAQQKLSKKRKDSNNYQKQRIKLQGLNKQLRDLREDFQHKLSDYLSKNHAVIVLEKLRVKDMTKSAKGTIENPGKNVAQKAGLNRAILRQGWSEFIRQVNYKCEWRGARFILVAPEYTSQRCSACGFVSAENRKTQAVFACVSCGHAENADKNAAKNILALGLIELQKPKEAAPKKPKIKKVRKKNRTAGQAVIACYEPVSSKAQKRAKALEANK